MGDFSESSHFSNIWFFFERFFAQNNSNNLEEWSSHVFGIFDFNFDPNRPFYKGYCLSKMGNCQIRLISRIFGVFSSGFLHRTTLIILKNGFRMFLAF